MEFRVFAMGKKNQFMGGPVPIAAFGDQFFNPAVHDRLYVVVAVPAFGRGYSFFISLYHGKRFIAVSAAFLFVYHIFDYAVSI